MKLQGEGLLVRIFVGESDRWEGAPLYEAIVQRAREKGLAGATVIRGIEGFGAHNFIHTARIQRLAEDLPIVIEIVDQRERVEAFLPDLDAMVLVPRLVLDRQVLLFHLPAQIVLGQRRALVGHRQLRREDRHVSIPARLAVPARGGQPGRSSTHDHQPHASHRSSTYFSVVRA